MKCYLNIGNTHTQILTVDNAGSRAVRTVATADFSPETIRPDGLSFIGAACVVERLFPVLTDINARLLTPEAASKFVDFSAVDASTLGQDRVANAVYLASKAELPAVSLDFGTCITAEVVEAKRRFLGGPIFPGRTLARKALHAYTSKLPLVELADELPPAPARTPPMQSAWGPTRPRSMPWRGSSRVWKNSWDAVPPCTPAAATVRFSSVRRNSPA